LFSGLIRFPSQESIRRMPSMTAILLAQADQNKPA
jgi:hypothetical protein